MVSLQTLKSYDFKSIHDYFDYILTSIINGQQAQAKTLAKQLSTAQKVDAIEYLEVYTSKQASECKTLILNTL